MSIEQFMDKNDVLLSHEVVGVETVKFRFKLKDDSLIIIATVDGEYNHRHFEIKHTIGIREEAECLKSIINKYLISEDKP